MCQLLTALSGHLYPKNYTERGSGFPVAYIILLESSQIGLAALPVPVPQRIVCHHEVRQAQLASSESHGLCMTTMKWGRVFPQKKKHKAEKSERTFPSPSTELLFIHFLRLSSQMSLLLRHRFSHSLLCAPLAPSLHLFQTIFKLDSS